MSEPFRWNIARREQLGRLVDGPALPEQPLFVPALRACAARALAFAGDADLLFVGRSPENLFDYLSGAFADGGWAERCALLNISLRADLATLRRQYPQAQTQVRAMLEAHGLAPAQLLRRPRPVALVDLVASGGTFGTLAATLTEWTAEERLDPRAVWRKLRFVGITVRTKTSPKTWRWQQHAAWARSLPRGGVRNVSIPAWLWDYWGNRQAKVTPWNPPWRWGAPGHSHPSRRGPFREALEIACALYDLGATPAERRALAELLAASPALRERWCRALILELRRAG